MAKPAALREIIDTVVAPNIGGAMSAPDDMRAVFNACAAVESLASAMYWWAADKRLISADDRDGTYKKALSKLNASFEIVQDVAEAQKHNRLTRGTRLVMSANDLQCKPHGLDYTRLGELMLDVGQTIAVTIDGQDRSVAPLARTALNFLEGEIVLIDQGNVQHLLIAEPKLTP